LWNFVVFVTLGDRASLQGSVQKKKATGAREILRLAINYKVDKGGECKESLENEAPRRVHSRPVDLIARRGGGEWNVPCILLRRFDFVDATFSTQSILNAGKLNLSLNYGVLTSNAPVID
jgi:hypothetical protein